MVKNFTIDLFFKNKIENLESIKDLARNLERQGLLKLDDSDFEFQEYLDPKIMKTYSFIEKNLGEFSLKISPSFVTFSFFKDKKDIFLSKLDEVENSLKDFQINKIKGRAVGIIEENETNQDAKILMQIKSLELKEFSFKFTPKEGENSYVYLKDSFDKSKDEEQIAFLVTTSEETSTENFKKDIESFIEELDNIKLI